MEKTKTGRMVIHTLFLFFADAENNGFEMGKKIKMAVQKALTMVLPDNGCEEYNGVMRSMRDAWLIDFIAGFNDDTD